MAPNGVAAYSLRTGEFHCGQTAVPLPGQCLAVVGEARAAHRCRAAHRWLQAAVVGGSRAPDQRAGVLGGHRHVQRYTVASVVLWSTWGAEVGLTRPPPRCRDRWCPFRGFRWRTGDDGRRSWWSCRSSRRRQTAGAVPCERKVGNESLDSSVVSTCSYGPSLTVAKGGETRAGHGGDA